MSSLPWHPIVVHFPLALVISAAVFFLAARLLRRDALAANLAIAGTWNLCLGAFMAVFALATGLASVLDLDVGAEVHQAISIHTKWAMFTTLLLILLAVWRGAGAAQASRPSWLFVIVLTVAAAALIVTGYRGGKNVYDYGVGVKKIAARNDVRPESRDGDHSCANQFCPDLSRRAIVHGEPSGECHEKPQIAVRIRIAGIGDDGRLRDEFKRSDSGWAGRISRTRRWPAI
jgi:uncharacterized membrane protein